MTKFTFATSKEGFDNHIDTSVRGYSQLWGDILSLSKYFVEDYTQVVDMGCSSGKLLKGMIEQNQKHIPHAQYTGIEIEEDFFEQCFGSFIILEWHYTYVQDQSTSIKNDSKETKQKKKTFVELCLINPSTMTQKTTSQGRRC